VDVSPRLKSDVRSMHHLFRLFGYDDKTMYPDVEGFSRHNSAKKPFDRDIFAGAGQLYREDYAYQRPLHPWKASPVAWGRYRRGGKTSRGLPRPRQPR
jgi:hypothetical protein